MLVEKGCFGAPFAFRDVLFLLGTKPGRGKNTR